MGTIIGSRKEATLKNLFLDNNLLHVLIGFSILLLAQTYFLQAKYILNASLFEVFCGLVIYVLVVGFAGRGVGFAIERIQEKYFGSRFVNITAEWFTVYGALLSIPVFIGLQDRHDKTVVIASVVSTITLIFIWAYKRKK